jgi:hypothetical protein
VDRRTLKKLDAELTEFVDELFSGLGRREEKSMDAADGAPLPSGRARTPNWRLPTVPKADRTTRGTDRTITNVIESY